MCGARWRPWAGRWRCLGPPAQAQAHFQPSQEPVCVGKVPASTARASHAARVEGVPKVLGGPCTVGLDLGDKVPVALRSLPRLLLVLHSAGCAGRTDNDTPAFGGGQRFLGPEGNSPGLLLGKRRLNMKHELVFCRLVNGHEINACLHHPGQEMNIPAQPVKFCYQKHRPFLSAKGQGRIELGPIHGTSRLQFCELMQHSPMVRRDVSLDCVSLGIQPQAAVSLFLRAHTKVTDVRRRLGLLRLSDHTKREHMLALSTMSPPLLVHRYLTKLHGNIFLPYV